MPTDAELREIVEQCWRVASAADLEHPGGAIIHGDWTSGQVQINPVRANVFYCLLNAQIPRATMGMSVAEPPESWREP